MPDTRTFIAPHVFLPLAVLSLSSSSSVFSLQVKYKLKTVLIIRLMLAVHLSRATWMVTTHRTFVRLKHIHTYNERNQQVTLIVLLFNRQLSSSAHPLRATLFFFSTSHPCRLGGSLSLSRSAGSSFFTQKSTTFEKEKIGERVLIRPTKESVYQV